MNVTKDEIKNSQNRRKKLSLGESATGHQTLTNRLGPRQVSMPFFGPPRRMNWLSLSSLVVECTGPAPQRPLCLRCLSTVDPTRKRQREGSMVCFCFKLNISSPKGSGPCSEVVLYRGNPWLGRGKPLFHSPVPKISLIYELLNEQHIRC